MSFSNAIADSAVKGLATAGHEVRRINLYKMPDGGCFSPLLSAEEREGYFLENDQPQLNNDEHVKYAVESLRWCDSLVLVYPTWWYNIPAILKGFFDRCFVPGVGFRYNKELGMREVGLQNIQQVGILTTYGFNNLQIATSVSLCCHHPFLSLSLYLPLPVSLSLSLYRARARDLFLSFYLYLYLSLSFSLSLSDRFNNMQSKVAISRGQRHNPEYVCVSQYILVRVRCVPIYNRESTCVRVNARVRFDFVF